MAVSMTTVSGPVQGGKFGWPFAASMLDMAKVGYKEAEYFLATQHDLSACTM